MKIQPKCLNYTSNDHKGAAYTLDGFMLPCCWLDDRYFKLCGLKDQELLLSNNERLEDIFTVRSMESL